MKILIVSQRYWPENFRITDIAESLASLGNDVTVLTGLPNYPGGYIYKGYRNGKSRNQVTNGVKIIRANEIGRRKNILFRFLNYYSFPIFAKRIVKKLSDDFDVVLINELSPIMAATPGLLYKKLYSKKVVMYEMDLWPDSLCAAGSWLKKTLLYKHFTKLSAKIYSHCDKILVSTKEHIFKIKSLKNCDKLKIDYLPQFADSIFENTQLVNDDNGVFDLMFAGNIGKAQSVKTIILAANILKDKSNIKFHIVGEGSEFANSKKLAEALKLNNVIFYGNRLLSEMPSLYSLADAMLVTLENKEYANLTIPGKIQSYMAVGKPIICCANGSTRDFVQKLQRKDLTCEAEDFVGLSKIILGCNVKELNEIGKENKIAYFASFSKNNFIKKLVEELEKVC